MPLKKSVLLLVRLVIAFFIRTNAQVVSLYNLFDATNSGFVPASGTITGTRVLADNATWVTFPSLINSSLLAGPGISITGTGPITISNTGVTSVGLSMPPAFTVTNSPVTNSGTLTVTGAGTTSQYIKGDGSLGTYALSTLTDATITTPSAGQILQYSSGKWINATPSYIGLTSLSGIPPITYNNTTGAIGITQSSSTTNGYLSSIDWNTFNSKQNAIALTTSGTSGPATLTGSTLNVPQYAGQTY